jgi:Ca2+:H+ antiporter
MAGARADRIPAVSWIVPVLGLAGWAFIGRGGGVAGSLAIAFLLIGSVLAAVHHAELVAVRLGDPMGTLVLTLAVTVIEVSLIVSMMLNEAPNPTLVRDTAHATVMLVVHGVAGLCIVVGALRHREQEFSTQGANAFLSVLMPMVVLVLVLPNFTVATPGPYYSTRQLQFVGAVCLALYAAFLFMQTVRHREYFLPLANLDDGHVHVHVIPPRHIAVIAGALLLMALVVVVLLAEALAPAIEHSVAAFGAPDKVAGIIVACIVLLPETLAALAAARINRLQTSINIALGSAVASIGLTIPVIVVLVSWFGHELVLGLEPEAMVLLGLSLLMAIVTYGQGRTNLLAGIVHLVLLACFLFLTLNP